MDLIDSSGLGALVQSSDLINEKEFSKPIASKDEIDSLERLHSLVIENKLTEPELIECLNKLPSQNVSHTPIAISQDQMISAITCL